MDSALLGANLTLSFLVTYLAHSTLLLAGAWLLGRALRHRALPVQDLAWKVALVGSFVTATLRVATLALERPVAVVLEPWAAGDLALLRTAGEGPHPGLTSLAGQLAGWERLLLFGWAAGAVIGVLLIARSWNQLRQCLANRQTLDSGPLRAALDRLLARAERPEVVRLSDAPALPVPVALGVLSPEICLPTRVIEELGEDARSAILAHELGHLVRRDPTWLLAARTIESVFFIQPLNRLARVRLQALSEYLADAWALEATGDRKGLAQCLVEVAGWLRPAATQLVSGMAGHRGQLTTRVQRILERNGASHIVRPWARAGSVVALGLIAVFAPGMAPPALLSPAPAIATTAASEAERPASTTNKTTTRHSAAVATMEIDEESIADGIAEGVEEGIEEGVEDGVAQQEWAELEDSAWPEDLGEPVSALAPLDSFGDEFEPALMAMLDANLGDVLPALAGSSALAVADAMAAGDPVDPEFEGAIEGSPATREERERNRVERERLRTERERLRAELHKLTENAHLSAQEIDRLRAEARALAERYRPSQEEVERMRAKAREFAQHDRLSQEQLETMRRDARAIAERHRLDPAQLERLKAEARALSERARIDRRERGESQRLEIRERTARRSARGSAQALAEEERRLEAALERVRALRAEVERDQGTRDEKPEPPR